MIITFIFTSGILLGSFLNMLIYRLPRSENWVTGRSMCIHCHHVLSVKNLVPILSYLCQLGRCSYCKQSIPIRYFLVECLTPLFLWIAYMQDPTFQIVFWTYAIFYLVCIAIFFTDIETYIIPNELSIGLVVFGLVERSIWGGLKEGIVGAIIGYGVYYLIAVVSSWIYKKDTMGGGDLRLAAGIGAVWGIHVVVYTLYFSFFFGAIIGLGLIALKIKSRKDYIPFGPMIIIAVLFTLWLPNQFHFLF